MEANDARILARDFPAWRRLSQQAPKMLRDYGYLPIMIGWMAAVALLTILAGLWLDMTLGRNYLFQFVTSHLPAPTPRVTASWTARMLATAALPSLTLAPLGPFLLRPFNRTPKRGLVVLGAGMLLSAVMVYSQQWHASFCSAQSCSASGVGPLDAVGRLSIYRLAPSSVYGMNHLSIAFVACLALIAALLIGHDVVLGRLLPVPSADAQSASEAEDTVKIEAELNNWKVGDASFGWHQTGVFDDVSDTGKLQATGYRIFAVSSAVTAKLAGVEIPEESSEEDPEQEETPTPRTFPTYDYSLTTDQ